MAIPYIASQRRIYTRKPKKYVSQFWISVMSKLESDQVVAVIIKIMLSDGTYKTLWPVQKVTKKDMKELVDTLKLFLNLRANDYSAVEVNKIQFQSILINKTVKVLFINL